MSEKLTEDVKSDLEEQIIKTTGENGETVYMKLQEVISVNNFDYALLSVVKDDILPISGNDEEDELVVMRMKMDENNQDECTFEIIESDEEFNSVVNAINEADELEDDDCDEE